MKYRGRIGSAAVLAAAALAAVTVLAEPASAATGRGASFGGASHVVFVQTDNTAGHQVIAYHRAAHGTLSFPAAYHTAGPGRPAHGLGHRSPGLPGLADLRFAALPALRGERGQRYRHGLRRSRAPPVPPAGHLLRRPVPGQRGRARQPGLRSERPELRVRPR